MLTHFGACPACLSHHDRLDVVPCGNEVWCGQCPNTGEAVVLHVDGSTSMHTPPLGGDRLTNMLDHARATAPPAPAAPVEVVEESVQDDLLVDPYFHADD